MSDIAKGMLVRHASLGVGKVVAVEATAVHVFFPDAEKRYAAKLRWPAAQPLLRADGVERNAWLDLHATATSRATGTASAARKSTRATRAAVSSRMRGAEALGRRTL